MKTFLTISLLALTVTSCGGYETLRDKFDFSGKRNLNLTGTTVERQTTVAERLQANTRTVAAAEAPVATSPSGAYEVDVNAPIGSVMGDATRLFHAEAKKICGNQGYSHKIVSQGMRDSNQYMMRGVETTRIPNVKGIVICGKKAGSRTTVTSSVQQQQPVVMQETKTVFQSVEQMKPIID